MPILLWLLALAPVALAEDSTGESSGGMAFGSPDAVENILEDTGLIEWKTRLAEEQGVALGLDYTTNLFGASDSLGEEGAWGGMVRFYGTWEVLNRGSNRSGALVWKVEHRHRTGDIAPKALAGELGYVGFIAPPYSTPKTTC